MEQYYISLLQRCARMLLISTDVTNCDRYSHRSYLHLLRHFLMLLHLIDSCSMFIVLLFIVFLIIVLLYGVSMRSASCSDCVACSFALHRGNARRSSTTSRNISTFVYCIVVFQFVCLLRHNFLGMLLTKFRVALLHNLLTNL